MQTRTSHPDVIEGFYSSDTDGTPDVSLARTRIAYRDSPAIWRALSDFPFHLGPEQSLYTSCLLKELLNYFSWLHD
jgi:hypothetical protein